MEQSSFDTFEKMSINPQIKQFLTETAKWSKFLSILGFIGVGFLILIGVFFGKIMRNLPTNSYENMGIEVGYVGLVYVLLAIIYFIPILYLFNFSVKMQKALQTNDEEYLTEAFSNLKSHYKFIGILMLVVFIMYALAIIFGIIFSMTT